MGGDIRCLGGERCCFHCKFWAPADGEGYCFALPPNPEHPQTTWMDWCSLFAKDTEETRSIKNQLMAEHTAQLARDLADATKKANLRLAAFGIAQSIRQGTFHERIERHKAEARGIRELAQ